MLINGYFKEETIILLNKAKDKYTLENMTNHCRIVNEIMINKERKFQKEIYKSLVYIKNKYKNIYIQKVNDKQIKDRNLNIDNIKDKKSKGSRIIQKEAFNIESKINHTEINGKKIYYNNNLQFFKKEIKFENESNSLIHNTKKTKENYSIKDMIKIIELTYLIKILVYFPFICLIQLFSKFIKYLKYIIIDNASNINLSSFDLVQNMKYCLYCLINIIYFLKIVYKEKIISFVFSKNDEITNYSLNAKNNHFEQNNVSINISNINFDKENKRTDITIIENKENKRKKYLIRNSNQLRNYIKIAKYIILLNLIYNIFAYNKISLIEYKSYYISLKIKGTGTKRVFSSLSDTFKVEYYPDEVFINEKMQTNVHYSYYLNQTDNIIKLIWNKLINRSDCMFFNSDAYEIDFSGFNTSNIESMYRMFGDCSSLKSLNFLNFNTSKVKSMARMFEGCLSLISLDLSNFDTSNVESIYSMFEDCSKLASLNLSNFNTSKVRDMRHMFEYCSSLTSLDLSNFDTLLVRDMQYMFYHCTSLTSLNLSNFDTSKVSNFIASKVENMNYMFAHCNKLQSLDISNFNTSNVKDMSYMFFQCPSLISLDISFFDTSKVTSMRGMFYNCRSLIFLNLSNFYNPVLEDTNGIFSECSSLRSIDLTNFGTSKVKDMNIMFQFCSNLTFLDLSSFNTEKSNLMRGMFTNCSSLISIDLSSFNTSQTKDMIKMFSNCSSLQSINLSHFDTSHVTYLSQMFYGCSSLTNLNLTKFDTSLVQNMEGMFYGCSSLTFLNLSNFDTSQVTTMNSIFYGCSSLNSIDLSSFNTSKANDVRGMFYNCSSLKSLDISHFDTSSVVVLFHMFRYCSSLVSLNLSNFDTSLVTTMGAMFENCTSLVYLDLSNFNVSNVTNMVNMFKNCEKLEYINLKNSDRKKENGLDNIFLNVPENIVLCINEDDKLVSKLTSEFYNIDCSGDYKSKQKIILTSSINECIEICDINSKFAYIGKCYDNNGNEYLHDNNQNMIINKCVLYKNLLCPLTRLPQTLCTKCNNIGYYQIENDNSNTADYINCYNKPIGYYFEQDELLYKKCYHTCKTCDIKGNYTNHNCIECNDDYPYIIINNTYKNCYNNCSYYHYIDKENNIHCTINEECPKGYPQLIENKKECIEHSIQNFQNTITNIMKEKKEVKEVNNTKNETVKLTKEEEKEYYEEVLQATEEFFKSENFDTSNIDSGKEEKIETEKMTITFTTTQNQKNNIDDINTTSIDMGDCEGLIRKYYNLSINETLYIKKIDIVQEGMQISKVGYDVYSKLFGKALVKLNLTACENIKISILIPVKINEPLDKLNSSSGYYNDVCYTTTSKDGTDITLRDRKKEYAIGDKIVCQEDCVFSDYDYNTFKAKCDCKAKESSTSIIDIDIDKDKFLKNIKDIKNFANFNFLVCYKKLLNAKGLLKNIGSYILLFILLFHLFSIIYFYNKQFPLMKNKIKDIIFGISEKHLLKRKNPKKKKESINKKKNDKNKNLIANNISKDNKISKKKVINKKNKRKQVDGKNKATININNNFVQKNNFIYKHRNITTNIIPVNDSIKKINLNSNNEQDKIEKVENIMKYIDEEINTLPYDLAIKKDKRSYCQYYISLLKTKHSLIFAFCNNNDYNSKIIKIDLFFIGFAISYTVNALFYDDDTMHKIYESKGQFDLEAQIPIIAYSCLISIILNSPLNLLALSNDAIISFKQNTQKPSLKSKEESLNKILSIRFVLFFFISFLFLLFFWYYISMFGVIYRNTQIHLLKDTLLSFGLSFIYPFGILLIPGFFRIPSLSNNRSKRQCLYNFSKIVQLI